jgi:ribosomal protein S18 acetylase RimI-like enzyme
MADNSPMANRNVSLRPMRPDEYPAWVAASKAGYANDIATHGGLPADVAQRKSETDFANILPDGLKTPGHAFFVVEADSGSVGYLWLAEREQHGQRTLFVYEIEIHDGERGKGYGRATMLLAEDEARSRGLNQVQLNVFGGNDVARGLYRSLGYQENAVLMTKQLSGP